MEIILSKLFVVSAPSGAGKTTMIHRAIDTIPELVLSVSHTSRKPRAGEKYGIDYFFISANEFKQKIERNEFLEWAEVHGNYYGTSIVEINKRIQEGNSVLLDIDVQGAQQIKKTGQLHPVYIFIEPPSMAELKIRLQKRETETEDTLHRRISNAQKEMLYKNQYDYVIVNDQLEKAVDEFVSIIKEKATHSVIR